jgi:2,3-bisphosphoglycerate-independent phosphoglycerate mutase
MKYIVLIIDGASGHPLPELNGKTSLEFAATPNLDLLANSGEVGRTMNVPGGMEPSSAIACMSLMGYDPKLYYSGRGPIEAVSMGIDLQPSDAAFRCNLVTLENGIMKSYCSGQITDAESHAIIASLNDAKLDPRVKFYPGVSYRHIAVIKNGLDLLDSHSFPPHDISDKPIATYRPQGSGGEFLDSLMKKSEDVLRNHPVNLKRIYDGSLPATSIWLFWGGGTSTPMPSFKEKYGSSAAITSGVDLLRGLGSQTKMTILKIHGVSGGLDNDYESQIIGALNSLSTHDTVFIHVESPDESGHLGLYKEKVKAIEAIDSIMVSRIMDYAKNEELKLLVLPDHPTPVKLKTHTAEPVPYMLWGKGVKHNDFSAYSESTAAKSNLFFPNGFELMSRVVGGN